MRVPVLLAIALLLTTPALADPPTELAFSGVGYVVVGVAASPAGGSLAWELTAPPNAMIAVASMVLDASRGVLWGGSGSGSISPATSVRSDPLAVREGGGEPAGHGGHAGTGGEFALDSTTRYVAIVISDTQATVTVRVTGAAITGVTTGAPGHFRIDRDFDEVVLDAAGPLHAAVPLGPQATVLATERHTTTSWTLGVLSTDDQTLRSEWSVGTSGGRCDPVEAAFRPCTHFHLISAPPGDLTATITQSAGAWYREDYLLVADVTFPQ